MRRTALGSAATPVAPGGRARILEDVHGKLHRVRVRAVARPRSVAELQKHLRRAARTGLSVSVASFHQLTVCSCL